MMEYVRIIFEWQTAYGLYRDALQFPSESIPSDEEVMRLQQERVNNWLLVVSASSAEEAVQDG